MKATKKMFIICLVLVLVTACLIPSTFSWYDHNDELTGDRMSYVREKLPVSSGTVEMTTKKYRMDGNKVYYDEKGNKEYDGDAITSGSVASGKTQYYGTTITNSGDAPAYVNLYLTDFTHNTQNIIGTTAPSLTHKAMSSTVHLANKNLIRVYFQVKDTNEWNTSGAKFYLVYKTKTNSNYANKQITATITDANDTQGILSHVKTYYVDLAENTTEFFFATDAKNSGFNTSTNTVTQNWYRTNTITDIQAERGYYLTGVADDTTWRAQYATFAIPGGVSVKTYFDKVTMASGQNAYVTLTEGTNYSGVSASYTASGNVTVNKNTGLVSSTLGTGGSATITTTIKGSLGDEVKVTTNVTNPATLATAAVALNVEIPGRAADANGDIKDGVAEVVWYIENGSGAACNFSSIDYTK